MLWRGMHQQAVFKEYKRTFSIEIDGLVRTTQKLLDQRTAFSANLKREEEQAVMDILKIGTQKMQAVIANHAQGSLFDEDDTRLVFKVVDKVPYEFSYVFTTEDGV